MSNIKDVIEIAIKGGWKDYMENIYIMHGEIRFTYMNDEERDVDGKWHLSSAYIDPEFWQALGKEMRWDNQRNENGFLMGKFGLLPEFVWKGYMDELMPYIRDGGTVEEYLISLINKE